MLLFWLHFFHLRTGQIAPVTVANPHQSKKCNQSSVANSESKQKAFEIHFKYKNLFKYRETLVKDTYSEMSSTLTSSCSLNFRCTVTVPSQSVQLECSYSLENIFSARFTEEESPSLVLLHEPTFRSRSITNWLSACWWKMQWK